MSLSHTAVMLCHARMRLFPCCCQVLAGEGGLEVTIKEHQCRFHFNFAEVYWNSRLSTEHARVIDLIVQGSSGGSSVDSQQV